MERKNEDLEKIEELTKILEIDIPGTRIKFMKRLGKIDDTYVRPLLIGFRNILDKETLLEKAKNLRFQPDKFHPCREKKKSDTSPNLAMLPVKDHHPILDAKH